MPFDPDRREAEAREDRAGEPRDANDVRGGAPERDRDQGDLFPWEEHERGEEAGAGPVESGPGRGAADRTEAGGAGETPDRARTAEPGEKGDTGDTADAGDVGDVGTAEGAVVPGSRRPPGLGSREKVLWEWPYPGDWIEEEMA